MHNYEEIWMFTQATACSNTAMFLCCAMTWWLYIGVLAVPSAPPTNVTIESVSSTVSNTYNASPDFPMKIVELVHVKSTRHTLICPDNFMFDFDVWTILVWAVSLYVSDACTACSTCTMCDRLTHVSGLTDRFVACMSVCSWLVDTVIGLYVN